MLKMNQKSLPQLFFSGHRLNNKKSNLVKSPFNGQH
jgi:hypothetical protein